MSTYFCDLQKTNSGDGLYRQSGGSSVSFEGGGAGRRKYKSSKGPFKDDVILNVVSWVQGKAYGLCVVE